MAIEPNRSLIDSLLPSVGIAEREYVLHNTTLPTGRMKGAAQIYANILCLAELFLRAAKETAEGIIHRRYKHFDALVGNFGCQITALYVQQRISDPTLLEQALILDELARRRLGKLVELSKKPLAPLAGLGISALLRQCGLDIQVSPRIAQLVRFRLLAIVNGNVWDNGQEKPITKIYELANKIAVTTFKKKLATQLITGLQIEESHRAITYIQREAAEIRADQVPRAALIQRLVSAAYVRSSSKGIASVPQSYNAEASVRRIRGIVLVKNKLRICDRPIPGALPKKVYLQMPSERILSAEDAAALPANEPLIVVEGYIRERTNLAAEISRYRLINLLKAHCSHLDQYASQTRQDPIRALGANDDDVEARDDLETLRASPANTVIDIDHIYCASAQEERV